MKISLNWIKDYVDLSGISEEEIVKRFNLSTAEIEDVQYMGKETSGVVFGKILEVSNHPTNPHWHILKVDVAKKEPLQIVCGAPNVRQGMVTCVATDGGKVNGFKISVAKRGDIDSCGMCCSEAELGIGLDDEGIIDLIGDYPIGADIKSVFPIDDVVLEIDNKTLTNRPDLWGHYGLAREFAVIFDRPLKKINTLDLSKFEGLKPVKINIQSKNCYRYSAIMADNITVKQSPDYIKTRLHYCGMRSINLLADLTNYVMMDVGLPMHAFDSELVNQINVMDSKDVSIVTLEGLEHKLPDGSIIIADQNKEPVAIAGIKGGKNSGITDQTTSVLFEAAVFNAVSVRKTSRAIGLITDSSVRYEKSLDPKKTELALARMLYLLSKIDKQVNVISSFSDKVNYEYPTINLEMQAQKIRNVIGANIETVRMVKILKGLGFDVKCKDEVLNIVVPSYRATKDISIKEDIIEEVARIYGYDNITPAPLKFEAVPVELKREIELEYNCKKLIAEKYDASEVHSHIWNFSNFNNLHKIEHSSFVKLMDSSNSGESGIRSELAPTLLKFFDENRNALQDIRIFEIGRVATGLNAENLAIEEKHLAILLASQTKTEKELFFEAKTIVLDLCQNVAGFDVSLKAGETSKYYHPVNCARIVSRTTDFGQLGMLHPVVNKSIDKRFNICLIEINFDKLCNEKVYYKKVKNISKYQQIEMDFNFLVDKKLSYETFENTLNKYRNKISNGFTLVDIYEDESLGERKSVTIRYSLGTYDHTLLGDEIEKFRNELIAHASKNNIILR